MTTFCTWEHWFLVFLFFNLDIKKNSITGQCTMTQQVWDRVLKVSTALSTTMNLYLDLDIKPFNLSWNQNLVRHSSYDACTLTHMYVIHEQVTISPLTLLLGEDIQTFPSLSEDVPHLFVLVFQEIICLPDFGIHALQLRILLFDFIPESHCQSF